MQRCRHGMISDWCSYCLGYKPSKYTSSHAPNLGFTAVVAKSSNNRPLQRASGDVYRDDYYEFGGFSGFNSGYTPGIGRN